MTVGGVELLTVTPAGRLSVSEKFVRFVSLGAKMSILNRELPPMTTEEGEKDLIPATSAPLTITLAFAGPWLPRPSSVVSPPAGIVFTNVPDDVPPGAVTRTETMQVPGAVGLPAGIVPPTKLILVDVVETVPPHVFVVTLTTVNGAGKLSVKFTPVYGEAVGFCNVMISVVVSPAENVEGENCFATPIACELNRAVAAVTFVRSCWVWSALAGIVLVYVPCTYEVTLTVIVQVELGAIVPLFSDTDVPRLTAVNEAESPHPVNTGETVSARKTPSGRLSVSETSVNVVLSSLFLITMESWLVPPIQIVLGLKLLFIEGIRLTATFKVALAGLVLVMFEPSPVEVSAPTGMVLIRFPAVVEVTKRETVQDPGVIASWAGTLPPLNEIVVEPATAVTEPPQELVNPMGLAITSPG